MIIIADSGSSKTEWALVNHNKSISYFKSIGINPFFLSSEEIFKILADTFHTAHVNEKVEKVFFYGAGCIKNLNSNIVENGLDQYFLKAEIFVEDDMIGAARSIFGNRQGIACILGTGANSCKYDGAAIIEKIPTLGYILGDEASGAYFGKILINNYFKQIMPDDLILKFKAQYSLDLNEVLNKVYKQPFPNRYLAKFTFFLSENIEHPYIQTVLLSGFEAFICSNIAKYADYKNYSIGFAGSIAHFFSELLIKAGENLGISIDCIVEKPISGLIQYHFTIK